MKSASTYYRMARKIQKQQDLRAELNAKWAEHDQARNGFTARDREIADEYEANEMLRKFIATELNDLI